MIRPNLRMGVGQLASLGDTQGNKIRGEEYERQTERKRGWRRERMCYREITKQREKDYCV